MTRTAAIVCAAAGFASVAGAQVTGIGPFTGDGYEGFEGIAPPGSVPGPVDIFSGDATVNDQFAGILVIASNLVSFVTNEEIFPYNGNLMGLSVTGFTEFTFDTPATDFGGYFGTADNLSNGTISFYDESNALIETVSMELPLNDWQWWGWSSSTPFSRVSIAGNVNPGSPIVFDDLRVNYVPAPAGSVVLALGGVIALRRRRSN